MERWSDFSRLNLSGMPAPSSTVTVYLTGTQTLASLYNSNSVADPKTNPFTAGTDGLAQFYAANARYDIRFSGGGITTPWSLGDTLLFDPNDDAASLWINPKLAPYNAIGNGIADDTAAIQAALNAAQAAGGISIWFPAGTYVVSATLTWNTTTNLVASPVFKGSGRFATKFDNQVANGALLKIQSTVANNFQLGGRIADFSILTTTNPVSSTGIYVKAAWQGTFENIQITGMSGNGVQIDMALGDADGCVQLLFQQCWLEHCGQYGLNVTQSGAASENSFLQMQSCFLQYNTLGGARVRALGSTFLDCAFVRNAPALSGGVGGLQYYATAAGSSRLAKLEGCTFEGNGVCHLDIQSCACAWIVNGEFLHNTADIATNPITTGIKLGGSGVLGGGAANVEITGSFVRNYTAGYVQVAVGSDTSIIRIRNTRWDVFDAATGPVGGDSGVSQTRFTNAGSYVQIEDDGIAYPYATAAKYTTMTAGTAYTPDAGRYVIHRLTLSQVGAYTINAPTGVTSATQIGSPLLFDLVNTSGGAVTVVWSAQFGIRSFTVPVGTDHRTVHFYFDGLTPWMQVGGWNYTPSVIQRGAGTARDDTFSIWDSGNTLPYLFLAGPFLGLGTAAPGTSLDILLAQVGATLARVRNTSADANASAGYRIGNNTSDNAGTITQYSSAAAKANMLEILNILNAAMILGVNSAEVLRMISTGGGRVGIMKAAPGTTLAVVGLPTYADNAAALLGGLTTGDFYKTAAGGLMVVL